MKRWPPKAVAYIHVSCPPPYLATGSATDVSLVFFFPFNLKDISPGMKFNKVPSLVRKNMPHDTRDFKDFLIYLIPDIKK